MWYLSCLNGTYNYLYDKSNYTIGRKNRDITLENDESISREHAVLKIVEKKLILIDNGSKYGTFIGERKLKHNVEYELSDSDLITFGLLNNNQCKFKVNYVFCKAIFSNVPLYAKNTQIETLDTLGFERLKVWHDSCTHIIAVEAKLTSKLLCGVIAGKQIVNEKFFPDFLKAVQNKTKLPDESAYKPPFNDILLNKNINLDFKPERQSLFKNLTFVFATISTFNKFSNIIERIGGKVMLCGKENTFPMSDLKKHWDKFIIISDCDDTDIPQSYNDAVDYFKSIEKRTIPSHEIPMAVVLNSREENCNPSFKRANLLVRSRSQNEQLFEDIWAFNTEQTSEQSQTPTDISDIPSVVQTSILSDLQDKSGKRSLEIEISSASSIPNKKAKVDVSDTFKMIKKPAIEVSSPRNEFSSKKRNCTPSETSETMENPFKRKRKAETKLKLDAKKSPLANISNVNKVGQQGTEKPEEKPEEKRKEKPKDISTTSTVVKLSTSWIKKEQGVIKEIKKEFQDEEMEKFSMVFKDLINVSFCALPPRAQNIIQSQTTDSVKNFKKFKKVNGSVQHEIIFDVTKIVVGQETATFESDIETDENEDDDMDVEVVGSFRSNTTKTVQKSRRTFVFN